MPAGLPPTLLGEHVPHDRQGQAAQNPPEGPGHRPGGQEEPKRRGQPAKQGPGQEPDVKAQERRLPPELVQQRRRHHARRPGAQRVGREDEAELSRRDRQGPHQLRSQRHDHHEVNDAGKLDRGQSQQDRPLDRRGALGSTHRPNSRDARRDMRDRSPRHRWNRRNRRATRQSVNPDLLGDPPTPIGLRREPDPHLSWFGPKTLEARPCPSTLRPRPDRPPTARRRARRWAVAASILLGLWLLGSYLVAFGLTRRKHARFEEPAPPVAWAKFEGVRLATRDGHDLGAWYAAGDGGRDLGRPPPRERRAPGAHPGPGRAALPGGLLGPAGHAPGPRRLLGRLQRHRLLGPARRRRGRGVPGASPTRPADRDPRDRRWARRRPRSPRPSWAAGSPATSWRRPTSTSGRPSGTGPGRALPAGLEWLAYRGLLPVAPLVVPDLDRTSPLRAIGGIPPGVPVVLMAGRLDDKATPDQVGQLLGPVRDRAGSSSSSGPDTSATSNPTPNSTAGPSLGFLRQAASKPR